MSFLPNIAPNPYDHIISLRIWTKPIGTRLTPKRLEEMNVAPDLLPNEKAILS